MHKGFISAVGSCLLWGLLPVYLKALHAIPALELLAHRVLWALASVLIALLCQRRGGALLRTLRCPKTLIILGATAALLACNWLLFLWAVSTNQLVESSLGYSISPLLTILFGSFLLQEPLYFGKKVAVGVAACGLLTLSLGLGHIPWLALVLGFLFASYALLHKKATVAAVEALAIELLWLAIPAAAYLLYSNSGAATLVHVDIMALLPLGFVGVFTAGILVLYIASTRQLSLVTLGFLQYITPTIQLILAVFLYHELFPLQRLLGFGLIWSALLVSSFASLRLPPLTAFSGQLVWPRGPYGLAENSQQTPAQ